MIFNVNILGKHTVILQIYDQYTGDGLSIGLRHRVSPQQQFRIFYYLSKRVHISVISPFNESTGFRIALQKWLFMTMTMHLTLSIADILQPDVPNELKMNS